MKNEYDYLNDVTVDFSKYEEIELSEKELKRMKKITSKKKIRIGRIAAVAACVALVAAFSQTTFAKQLMDGLVKSISTGHNSFYQYDMSGVEIDIPEELAIFYDENGNPLKKYTVDTALYDKDGNKIEDMEEYINSLDKDVYEYVIDNMKVKLAKGKENNPLEDYRGQGYAVIDNKADMTKLSKALDFTPILPAELPEGFRFLGAAYFDTSGYYLNLLYANDDDYFVIHERLINEETAFEMATDGTIEELKINGHTAVLTSGRSLDWEVGDIAVGISGRGLLNRDELIKMAEGME